MKRVLVLLLFMFILVFVASPTLANSTWFSNWNESPSGFGEGGSSSSGSGFVSPSAPLWVTNVASNNGFDSLSNQVNQAFASYEVPWWIKVLEVKNNGKASPFYDEVMDSPGSLSGLSIWDSLESPSGFGDFSDTSGSSGWNSVESPSGFGN